MKRIVLITLAALLLGGLGYLGWWLTRPSWPQFAAAANNEPQAIVKIERDYAHHLGDLIQVDVFVRQQPGTTIDLKSLSVGGDFELSAKQEVSEKKLEDGSVVYRFHLKMQSFKVQKKQVMTGSFGWRAGDQRRELTLEPLAIYTSNTYDGRKKLMEGPDARVSFWTYGMRHIVPLAASSIIFLVLVVVAFRRAILAVLNRPVVVDEERERVVELLRILESGNMTKDQHLELDALIRHHFKVGPIPCSELDGRGLNSDLVAFLKANEPGIYAEDALDPHGQETVWGHARKLIAKKCW